jgi:hypothetical protein
MYSCPAILLPLASAVAPFFVTFLTPRLLMLIVVAPVLLAADFTTTIWPAT